MKLSIKLVLLLIMFSTLLFNCTAEPTLNNHQEANITEEYINFKTYPFSDPNPVPNIGTIYPYFKFDGYTNHAIDKKWKMVVMENEYIKVFVCPEIGGKIWAAIEKSTGKEFLYYNHVVKFRNIAMRGPWTSGGLEFNFGDIGHAPSCSTPVDYIIVENPDGSVSCIVGAYDLPSRTRWNIKINLPKDKAYIETKVCWFNTTGQSTSYYQWMNAAAKAKGNLEFYYPGSKFIGHEGEPGNWPVNEGRTISKYEDNNFGGYKSYHVLNAYSDYFGGYWHDDDFGFGHYSLYDEKPGKKLWIWGLSQQGMIWEDLLTDTDGQYIEYQSGKLFNQAAEGSSQSPFKHKEFEPYASDIISELWFPLKETGGITAASKHAVLNIKRKGNSGTIYLSALEPLDETLTITLDGKTLNKDISLQPLDIDETKISIEDDSELEVVLGNHLLHYSTDKKGALVDRPIDHHREFNWNSAYGKFVEALELEKQRKYAEALKTYKECVAIDPGFLDALSRLSLGYYRMMDYEKALFYSRQGLSIDTYHPESNYAFGLVNKKLNHIPEAKSGFSIASQSLQFRSAAYVELAKLYLLENNYPKAKHYANKSIASNSNNIFAYMLLAYACRKSGQPKEAEEALQKVCSLDPLSDFARMEEVIQQSKPIDYFTSAIRNELPHESYLELAAIYNQLNDPEAAKLVLKQSPKHPIVELWLAALSSDPQSDHLAKLYEMSAEMVFPHRRETAEFLTRFIKTNSHWKLKYYLGLIYWNKGLIPEAQELFKACGNQPDFSAFYLAKNELLNISDSEKLKNLERARQLNPGDWRTALELSKSYQQTNDIKKAIALMEKFTSMYSENSQLGLQYVKLLNADEQYKQSLEFLETFEILPFEGSTEGKIVYTQTCINLAINALQEKKYTDAITYAEKSKLWPQNLGVGKPYFTDDRLANFIIALAHSQQGDNTYYEKIAAHKHSPESEENANLYLQLLALEKTGQEHKAAALLKKIRETEKDNQYIDWVNARFKNNSNHLQIQKELLASDKANATTDFTTIIDLLNIIKE